jgi:hypothetical protein
VRLTKGDLVGAIRPLRITYAGESPSIPITPTAVAANQDMGILVWLVSEARSVPLNYKSVELNEALIDWFNPGANYASLVSAAADEGSGQAFVTEYAGAMVAAPSLLTAWDLLVQAGTAGTPDDVLRAADALCASWWAGVGQCSTWDGWDEALLGAVTLPKGAQLEDLEACLAAPEEERAGLAGCEDLTLERVKFDAPRFLAAFTELVLRPVVDTWALFAGRPNLTRLYTTLSPDEMTVDPVFGSNRDLPPVSNLHQLRRDVACDATWTLGFPSGVTVRATFGGTPETWPVHPAALPAAQRILQYGTEGPGVVLEDHTPEFAGQTFGTLDCHYQVPDADLESQGDCGANGAPGAGKRKEGCSVTADGHERNAVAFLLLAVAAARLAVRRARRTRA